MVVSTQSTLWGAPVNLTNAQTQAKDAGEVLWAVDAEQSRIGFMTENLVMLTVRGRFRGVTGGFIGVESDTRSWRFAAAVLADSIDTGSRWRDALMRSRHILNTSHYPIIAFDRGRIEGDVRGVMRLHGDLTLCGVTREVAFLASNDGRSADLQRGDRLHYSATGRIDTHEFNVPTRTMLRLGGFTGDTGVWLTFEVELVRPRAGAGATKMQSSE